jgi:hypothetical protein
MDSVCRWAAGISIQAALLGTEPENIEERTSTQGRLGRSVQPSCLGTLLAKLTTNGCSVILRVLLINGNCGYKVV